MALRRKKDVVSCSVKNKDTKVKLRYLQWNVELHLSNCIKQHYIKVHFVRLPDSTVKKWNIHMYVSNNITSVSAEVFDGSETSRGFFFKYLLIFQYHLDTLWNDKSIVTTWTKL
jgi:hypothetical protein